MKQVLAGYVAAFLFFVGCDKESVSPFPPEDILVSGYEVLQRGIAIQKVAYTYDAKDRVVRMEILQVNSEVQEIIELEYFEDRVVYNVVISSGGSEIADYRLECIADETKYLQSYNYESHATGQSYSVQIFRDEFNRIIGFSNLNATIEYSDFGPIGYMLELNTVSVTDRIEYNLAETATPGVFTVALLPELHRVGDLPQAILLEQTGFLFNPPVEYLPTKTEYGADTSLLTWNYQYARDKDGRLNEMRRFTPDFLRDYRIVFSYINKQNPG